MKLKSELGLPQSKRIFTILHSETDVFDELTNREAMELLEAFKILSFQRGNNLTRKEEPVEFFGIIMSGRCILTVEEKKIGALGIGDMIGYLSLTGFDGNDTHQFTVTALNDGYLALITDTELKILCRKTPLLGHRLCSIAMKKGLKVVAQQILHRPFNNIPDHEYSIVTPKKIHCSFADTPPFTEFVKLLEDRERKLFYAHLKCIEFGHSTKIVRPGTMERSIFFLAKGECLVFEDFNSHILKEGSIIGIKEFLFGKEWKSSIISKCEGYMYELRYSGYKDLIQSSAMTGINLHKCVIHAYIKLLGSEENVGLQKTNKLSIPDIFQGREMYFEVDVNSSEWNKLSNAKEEEKTGRSSATKYMELYMAPVCVPLNQIGTPQENINISHPPPESMKSTRSMGSQLYKSSFLNDKVIEQLSRAKQEKSNTRKNIQEARKQGITLEQIAAGALNEDKFTSPKREDGGSDTNLEYDQLKADYDKLEVENNNTLQQLTQFKEENEKLKRELFKQRETTGILAQKLNKSALLRQIKDNEQLLENNNYLTKKFKASGIQNSLGSTIKEQHLVASKKLSVAKFAYRWLRKVRERKRQREAALLKNQFMKQTY